MYHDLHYYNYIEESAIASDLLRELRFGEFISFCKSVDVHKLVFWRTVPVFLVFGVSHFIFVYSNTLLNLTLLIILYAYLTVLFEPKKAFMFTLCVMASHFFLQLLMYIEPDNVYHTFQRLLPNDMGRSYPVDNRQNYILAYKKPSQNFSNIDLIVCTNVPDLFKLKKVYTLYDNSTLFLYQK